MARRILTIMLALGLVTTAAAPFAPMQGAKAQAEIACEQDYTVAAGDWLSLIAEKFYGDVSAYRAILLATNLKAETDDSYVTLTSADSIAVGDKLCIPNAADAEELMNAAVAATESPAATESDAEPTVTASVTEPTSEPTVTIPATPTATATAQPPAATSSGLTVDDVAFAPYGLGREIVGVVVPATPYDNSEPPGPMGAPSHIRYDMDGEERLWVIPAQEYQAQWNAAGNSTVSDAITQLRLLLRDQPENPKPPLPALPPVPATNDLAARVRYVEFKGGKGIIYLARWAQDPSPVLASQVYFTFLGLTDDGKYVVGFRYPVLSSALPDTVDELTPEHRANIEADPQTYFAETTNLLNQLKNSDFGPDLSRLDALVQSIIVPSTGAALPTPAGTLATPSAAGTPNPQATTRAPTTGSGGDVVRLRTGEWKWLRSVTPEETITVTSPESYSLRFNNAGGFGITADCNFGAGNYTVSGDQLVIEDLQSTLVFCGEESQDAIFTEQLVQAVRYSFEGTSLLLHLADDAGTMYFGR